MQRIKGVREKSDAKLSNQGMTMNGAACKSIQRH